jgi:hypothetical protein
MDRDPLQDDETQPRCVAEEIPGRRCERRGMCQLRDRSWLCWDHAPQYEMTTRMGELMQERKSFDCGPLFTPEWSSFDP